MSNRGKIWTVEEITQLRALVANGAATETIAEIMGRTPGGIQARIGALLHAELERTPRDQVFADWKISSDDATVYLDRYAAVLRNQPAQKIAELTEIVRALTIAVLDPSAVTAEQRAMLIAGAQRSARAPTTASNSSTHAPTEPAQTKSAGKSRRGKKATA